jgi:hypothetical protein
VWQDELDRATLEARELESQFSAAQGRPRLRERLAAKCEDALAAIEALEQRIAVEPPELSLFDESDFGELRSLVGELPILFWANTTDNFDRKRILSCIVSSVFIRGRTDERISVRIAWQDGAPDTEIEVFTPAYGRKLAEQLAAEGKGIDEIVLALRERGILTRWLRPYSRESVRAVLALAPKEGAGKTPIAEPCNDTDTPSSTEGHTVGQSINAGDSETT